MLFVGAYLGQGDGTTAGHFLNTATLSGLKVFDNVMQPIDNPMFVSGSGTQYSTDGVVPEPSTYALVATALALLFFGRNRQARKQ